MNHGTRLESLSDEDLLARTTALVAKSRRVEAELVAHLGEVDARRLYLGEACPSMFVYATDRLHLSEAEAYLRITVARTSRRFPVILDLLADGRLHLSAVARLAPHLREDNAVDLLARAVHRSKRDIEQLVAELAPRPDAPSQVRKLPAPAVPAVAGPLGPGGARPADPPPRPPVLVPIAPARFRVQFTASSELEAKLGRARALLRHQIPSGDLAEIIERAVTLLLAELERSKCAATSKARKSLAEASEVPTSRHIPAPIRRAVWERDGGQCTFVDRNGRRCPARERLEFHHIEPFARGGRHQPANLKLFCRSHNGHQADLDYGREFMEPCVRAPRLRSPATRAARPAATTTDRPSDEGTHPP